MTEKGKKRCWCAYEFCLLTSVFCFLSSETIKDMRLGHAGKIKTEFALEFFDALENLFQHGLLDTG